MSHDNDTASSSPLALSRSSSLSYNFKTSNAILVDEFSLKLLEIMHMEYKYVSSTDTITNSVPIILNNAPIIVNLQNSNILLNYSINITLLMFCHQTHPENEENLS